MQSQARLSYAEVRRRSTKLIINWISGKTDDTTKKQGLCDTGDQLLQVPDGREERVCHVEADIVDAIREFIPNFQHEEKGKNLDSEM